MAYETNTVLGASALLAALETFLVANGWTVVRSESISGGVDFTNNNLVVSNTGFGGNDIIYAGFELDTDDLSEGSATYANLKLQSFTSFNSASDNDDQSGAIEYPPLLMSEVSGSIDYHFICNDRRIIVITSHSSDTIWESAYIGHILPYGTREEFPSPVLVGGSYGSAYNITAITNTAYAHSAFWNPYISGHHNDDVLTRYSQCLLKSGSRWLGFCNKLNIGSKYYDNRRIIMPYASNNNNEPYGSTDAPIWQSLGLTEDGCYALFPIVLLNKFDDDIVYGEIDGIFAVIGSGISAGDTIEYDSEDYLIVQNAHFTDNYDLCAVKLT